LPRASRVIFIAQADRASDIPRGRCPATPPLEKTKQAGTGMTATQGDSTEVGSGTELGANLGRVLIFALGWWLVTEGRGGVITGALVVAAAAFTSAHLAEGQRVRVSLRGVAKFVPYFIEHSVRGGIDVAWRAFHPALPLGASVHDMELRLDAPAARSLFAAVVSLLPGTLSVDLEGSSVRIHVLAGGESTLERLRDLEAVVGAVVRS
jgi:multicomponent Na+:H+ antiporter subunit E